MNNTDTDNSLLIGIRQFHKSIISNEVQMKNLKLLNEHNNYFIHSLNINNDYLNLSVSHYPNTNQLRKKVNEIANYVFDYSNEIHDKFELRKNSINKEVKQLQNEMNIRQQKYEEAKEENKRESNELKEMINKNEDKMNDLNEEIENIKFCIMNKKSIEQEQIQQIQTIQKKKEEAFRQELSSSLITTRQQSKPMKNTRKGTLLLFK